jgi:hypothetical protein
MGKRFVVEDSFWQVFPDVEIGVLCVDGIKPTDQIGEEGGQGRGQSSLDRANASAGRVADELHHQPERGRRRVARRVPQVQDEEGRALLTSRTC